MEIMQKLVLTETYLLENNYDGYHDDIYITNREIYSDNIERK